MSFEAKYGGPCAYGDRINPGDYCRYTDDDEIAHVECHTLDGPANTHTTPPLKVCPVCQLEHRGECW